MVSRRRGVNSREERVLNRKECCDLVVRALDHHITIPIQGTLNQKTIFQALAGMAASNQSIHSASYTLAAIPCETSFRYHLNKLDIDELERINNLVLTYSIQAVLKRGTAYRFAIDITHDPYYGETIEENEGFVIHSQLKKSTTDFYSYVTVYVINHDRQMTLAVYPLREGMSKIAYLTRCLDQIAACGFGIEVLCLDREFYAKKVISFLKSRAIPFIVPVKCQGNQMKDLLDGRKSRIAMYIMKSKPADLILTIAIAVKYFQGKGGKHGSKNLGYVVSGIGWNPRKVHTVYRSRFAIESSYRMRNQVKPRTSTRNPLIRYLYAIVSLLLKNAWVVLLHRYFSRRQRGPRTVDSRGFSFVVFQLVFWDYIFHLLKLIRRINCIKRPV
jgi:putative transposase